MEVFNQQKKVAKSQRLAIFMNGTNRYTVYVVQKVGTQIFFSPKITNPQILGLIPQSQIRTFLR
jgi:hypothetical protein